MTSTSTPETITSLPAPISLEFVTTSRDACKAEAPKIVAGITDTIGHLSKADETKPYWYKELGKGFEKGKLPTKVESYLTSKGFEGVDLEGVSSVLRVNQALLEKLPVTLHSVLPALLETRRKVADGTGDGALGGLTEAVYTTTVQPVVAQVEQYIADNGIVKTINTLSSTVALFEALSAKEDLAEIFNNVGSPALRTQLEVDASGIKGYVATYMNNYLNTVGSALVALHEAKIMDDDTYDRTVVSVKSALRSRFPDLEHSRTQE